MRVCQDCFVYAGANVSQMTDEPHRQRGGTLSRLGRLFGAGAALNDASGAAPAATRDANSLHSQESIPSQSTESPAVSRAPSTRRVQVSPQQQHVQQVARFMILQDSDGTLKHEHHLKVVKRQEKLGQMVKDWIGGSQKKRSEAVSAVPGLFPPTLFATYMEQRDDLSFLEAGKSLKDVTPLNETGTSSTNSSQSENFEVKYGKCQEVIGKGTFGVVRVAHKKLPDKTEVLYAVKEFTRKQNEPDKKYSSRLTNEFCISSSLKHVNIISAFDLFKDSKGDYCEVMEYCQGGDLYSLIITAGKLEYAEADCFFKQLVRAVHYMHSMGVSHRDLKPENILLTHDGTLKITDFGNSECFKMAWEDDIQLSHGVSGSSPYIAPEEYTHDEYDPRCVDVWACGVIYMSMRTGRQLWGVAKRGDSFYEEYLKSRRDANGYEPIESLKRARCRNVIYSVLDPKPDRRITAKQVLNSEWVREVVCCKSVA